MFETRFPRPRNKPLSLILSFAPTQPKYKQNTSCTVIHILVSFTWLCRRRGDNEALQAGAINFMRELRICVTPAFAHKTNTPFGNPRKPDAMLLAPIQGNNIIEFEAHPKYWAKANWTASRALIRQRVQLIACVLRRIRLVSQRRAFWNLWFVPMVVTTSSEGGATTASTSQDVAATKL